MKTRNSLKSIRENRDLSAADLAQRIGVSRQTIYAMEAGAYVPNTTIALQLSRELGATVEELFTLDVDPSGPSSRIEAQVLTDDPLHRDQPVRLCRVEGRTLAVPVSPVQMFLPDADGIAVRELGNAVEVQPLDAVEFERRVLVAGCDPGLSVLAGAGRHRSAELVVAAASSRKSLEWLKKNRVHIAGSHLRDPATGEYNLPFLKRLFGDAPIHVATFASWQEGLLVARGNPKSIREIADLGRKDVRIVNREEGAGSRQLLDRKLKKAGISREQVRGYKRILLGHLPAAEAVAAGQADCCVATEIAARLYGLDFLPLATERFDLVTFRKYLDLPSVTAVFEALNQSAVRKALTLLAGYDTSQTGAEPS